MTEPYPNIPDLPVSEEKMIKEKINELEAQLTTLKVARDISQGFKQYVGGEKWKTLLFIVPLLFLSFLVPLFVVMDRWFQINEFENFSRDNWCKIQFLCQSHLPSYFSWIFFLIGLIFILMIVFAPFFQGAIEPILQKNEEHDQSILAHKGKASYQKLLILSALIGLGFDIGYCVLLKRIPGLELLLIVIAFLAAISLGETEISDQAVSAWVDKFKSKIPLYATILFSEVALILFLREAASFNRIRFVYYLLLVFALSTMFWQRKKLNKIYWIFTLAIVLFTFQLKSWKFSMIGDEYSFFFYPVEVISHQSFLQITDYFFNIKGVYDIVPYFSSFLTYLSMVFFGFDDFGWHLSNNLLMALMIPLLYDFLKSFISERTAFLAVIPLAFSHYLINFSKIGYTNLQAVFMMCLVLWVANKALRSRTYSAYAFLGVCVGFCFYAYPLGLYTVPIGGFFILLFDPPRSRAAWLRYAFAFLGLLIMMVPIFFQPIFWSNMAGRTVFFINNGSIISASNRIDLLFRFASNLLYIPFVYLFIPGEGNYIVSSLVDPLLAIFIPLGFLLSVLNLRRNRFLIFLTGAFLFELLIISVTNPYDAPPLTRMFLFIPFYFVFAILGLDWVAKIISSVTHSPRKIYWNITAGVLITAGLLNMFQSSILYDRRTERYAIEPVVLRMFQHDAIESPGESKVYLFLTDPDFTLFWFITFQDVYGVPESKTQLLRLIMESPQISSDWLNRIKNEENMVVVVPYSFSDSIRRYLTPVLAQTGKISCDVSDVPYGNIRFQIWYSPKFQKLCSEAQAMY